jgi:hypothetical protein
MLKRLFPFRIDGWLLASLLIVFAIAPQLCAQAPAAGGPQSDTGKWLAANDAKWQATYQRDVAAPFEKAVAELRRQYLASLTAPLAAATQAGHKEEAALWTAERQAMAAGGNVPAADDPGTPTSLKSLRASYREQFARLDKQRFDRARALFAQCDAVLAKNQAALAERNRPNEAAELQRERDQLRTAWLQPPATTTTGVAQVSVKMTPQKILEKLLALNAAVWVKPGKGDPVQVKSATQLADQKFTFWRVELPPTKADQTPLVAADYVILDSLSDLTQLAMSGENVTDAVIEKLRPYRALQSLTIGDAKIGAASYNLFTTLPELRELYLGNTGTSDDALKTIMPCRKLKSLHLVAQPISDDALANLSKMPALEELELNQLDKLGSPGFAHLADCRTLKQIYVAGITLLSGMVENLGHCKSLEVITLPGSVLKDGDIAPLSALSKLRSLDLEGSGVTGTAFASWPMRLAMTGLNLTDAAGVDDAVLKNIEHAFPKVEELDVKLAASGFGPTGAAIFARLHSLQTLRIGGAGVTDEVASQLAHCDTLTLLAIPAAKLTEPGVAALAKLPHLAELSLDQPPLSDTAMKSFGRCKELKTVNIGKDALPETEGKLQHAIPNVVVHRPEE